MKDLDNLKLFIISFLLLISLFSCQQDERYPSAILQTEKLMDTNPDSAAQLLALYQDSVRRMPIHVQMYYDLLSVKVKDKCCIPHSSDSVINRVTRYYYEEEKDPDKLMEAYHYMGCVYWTMKDAPHALEYYQKAVEIAEVMNNYHDLAHIYNRIGELFVYQDIYEEALPMYHKSRNYLVLDNDSLNMPGTIRDLARVYGKIGQSDTAIAYYQQARGLAQKNGNKVVECSVLRELGSLYNTMGEYTLASQCLYQALNNADDKNLYMTYLELGDMYLETHCLDSACSYLNKSINNEDASSLSRTYKCLTLLAEIKGNFKEAVKYNHLHWHWRDSVTKITNAEAIRKMVSLYNYQRAERKSETLTINNEKKQISIYQLASFLTLIVSSCSVFLLWRSIKRKDLMRRRLQQDEIKKKQYEKSRAYIEENGQKIKKLEAQLLLAKDVKNEKQIGLIQAQKEMLEITNQKVFSQQKEQAYLIEGFKKSDIYHKFHNPFNWDVNTITEEEWSILQDELNKVYDNFTNRLYALYPQLSIIELRICCLLKISISVTNMAMLLGRSKSAITAARIRLHSKLRGEKGTTDMLDAFIAEL